MQTTSYERYKIKQEPDGSWLVFDIFTGMPVVVAGKMMVGFREELSRELLGLLNAHDILRRAKSDI
jgi:predicted thioesterase